LSSLQELRTLPVASLLWRVADNEFKEATSYSFRRGLDRLDSLAVRQFFTKDVVVALAPPVELWKPRQAAGSQQNAVQVRPVLNAKAQVIRVEGVLRLACFQAPVMTKRQHAVKQHGIISDCDAALSGRDRLWPLKAEAADVAPRSYGTVAIKC